MKTIIALSMSICLAACGGGAQQSSTNNSTNASAATDTSRPTAPSGLAVQAVSATQVNLTWAASTDNVGISKYQILRSGSAGVLAETTATNYSDATVAGSADYSYQVKALDAAGNASELSAAATVRTPQTPDSVAPSTPSGLIAKASSATIVNLTWAASTDNVGVTKYQIMRANSPGVLAETTLTSYSDSTVVGDTNYAYQVKALDAANNASSLSNPATVRTLAASDVVAPAAPAGLAAQAVGTTRVDLSWAASSDNIGVVKYQVFRVGSAGMLAETTDTSYSDLTVVGGTEYTYQVKALDAANNASGLSVDIAVKTPAAADSIAPSAPANLSAHAIGATRIDLSWTASSDNVGVTKYQVFRIGNPGVLAETGTTNYSDLSVVGDTNYSYQVKAFDAANNASPPSNTAIAKTQAAADTVAPTAPGGLLAQAISATKINLTWTAATDNVGVVKYQVFRIGSTAVLAETAATSYSDTTALGGTSYSYQVKALDAANNASPLSNTASASTPAIPRITTQPVSLTVAPGQPASFTVVAVGTAPFWYHWYRNGTLIAACTTNVCSVASAGAGDAGSYAVEVGNDVGHLSSATAVLTVSSTVTVTAASCMRNDVQAALTSAPAGATVMVPSGTCDWGSAPTVKRAAGVWLKGAGKNATIIQRTGAVQILHPNDNPPNTYFMMEFDCTNGQKVEVSDITFLGNDDLQDEATRLYDNDSGLSLVNGCTDFKIHDAKFNKFSDAGLSIRGAGNKGVVYASEFTGNFKCQPDPVSCLGYGIVVMGNNTWPALSLGSANAVFIEDNVFSDNRHAVASNYGSQYVVRHNTITTTQRARNFGMLDAHGLTSTHGSRSWEIYQNTFVDSSTTHQNTTAVNIRGGDGVLWGNIYPSSFHSAVIVSAENSCKDDAGNLKPYPLADQTTDAWIWGNTISAPTLPMANYFGVNDAACTAYLMLDRDYHLSAKPGYVPYTYPHPLR